MIKLSLSQTKEFQNIKETQLWHDLPQKQIQCTSKMMWKYLRLIDRSAKLSLNKHGGCNEHKHGK